MADIKNFGIVGVGGAVQYGKAGGSIKWDTDKFVSTSDGTTLANLEAAEVNFTSLVGTGAVSISNILDEDNMASDSSTAIATQQSIKAYVDTTTGALDLSGTGDSGTFTVNLDSGTLGVVGGNNITTTGSGANVSIALDSDITIDSANVSGNVDAGNVNLTGSLAVGTGGAGTISGVDLLTVGNVDVGNVNATGDISAVNGEFSGSVTFGTGSGGSLTGLETFSANGVTASANLTINGFLVDGIIDDDTMANASATTLSTSESVKAYVDSQVTAQDLDIAGNSGTGAVDLDSQSLTIDGGTGLTSTASGQTITMNLDATGVTAKTYGSTTEIPVLTVNAQGQLTAVSNATISTAWTLAGDSGSETVSGGDTATFTGGTNITTAASATDTLTINLDSDITIDSANVSGNVDAGNMNLTNSLTVGTGGTGTISGVDVLTAGNVNAGNVNVTDAIVMGAGVGGSITGADSISANAITASANLTVNGFLVDGIIDDDTMGTASNTTLSTSESVKAYVDSQVTAQDLDFAGNSGTGAVDLDSQSLTIDGGTGLTSVASGQTLTVNMDATGVTAKTYGSSTEIPVLTVNAQGQVTAASNASINTSWTMAGDSGSETVSGGDTATFTGGTNITTVASATDTLTINLDSDITIASANVSGNIDAGNLNLAESLTVGNAGTGTISGVDLLTAGNIDVGNVNVTDAIVMGGGTGGTIAGADTISGANITSTNTLTFNELSDGTLTMSAILDEDNMASDSDTALATQQSIKAYVDTEVSALSTTMLIQGDAGSGNIAFASDTLDIAGTANEVETSYDNSTKTLTIGLPDDVTIAGNATITGTLLSDDITAATVAISGDMTVTGDTVMTGNLTVNGNTTIINSNTITSGDAVIVMNADLPGTQAPSQDVGFEFNRGSSANVEIKWLEGTDYFVFRDENGVLQEVRAATVNATTFTGGDFNGTSATLTGDVSFGTLTDSGESISVTKFVDEADGITSNDNDTTIPTSAAVKDYVDNNAGDGNLLRNGSVGTGSSTVTIAAAPSTAGRTYYVEKVVVKVTVAFSGSSVDHITVAENNGSGSVLVANADADISTGTYIIESDGATTLTAGQDIDLAFRDASNNLVAPTAGAASVAVYYGWV
jgi:hypothetical protein